MARHDRLRQIALDRHTDVAKGPVSNGVGNLGRPQGESPLGRHRSGVPSRCVDLGMPRPCEAHGAHQRRGKNECVAEEALSLDVHLHEQVADLCAQIRSLGARRGFADVWGSLARRASFSECTLGSHSDSMRKAPAGVRRLCQAHGKRPPPDSSFCC